MYNLSIFQVHIANNSEVADHCRAYALSYPNETDYITVCHHEHNMKCDRCRLFPDALTEVGAALEDVECSAEEREDMEYVLQNSFR